MANKKGAQMTILNQSQTEFSYTLPDGTVQTETIPSNIVNTEVITDTFLKVKSSDRSFLQEGETATQTVTLTNNSLFYISSIFFKDILSAGASYVPGSVVVNGVAQPSYDLAAGFNVGDLPIGSISTIIYQIIADNPLTQNPVTNYGNVNYNAGGSNFTENTNLITLPVVSNRLTVVKAVDKAVAIVGDNLHYTSTITNTGTLLKTNLTFTDTIPTGTNFVANSVRINGVAQAGLNPNTGFALPDLAVGASVIVEFDVVVI